MFNLENSCHGQMCIQGKNLSPWIMNLVAKTVTNNYTDSDDYKMSRGISPFLQGEDKRGGWVLVEFWTHDKASVQVWIDYLNKKIETEKKFRAAGVPDNFSCFLSILDSEKNGKARFWDLEGKADYEIEVKCENDIYTMTKIVYE